MLGAWCGQWGWQFPDDEAEHWWRTDGDPDGCGNRGSLQRFVGGAEPTSERRSYQTMCEQPGFVLTDG
jgi:hypothetical protein